MPPLNSRRPRPLCVVLAALNSHTTFLDCSSMIHAFPDHGGTALPFRSHIDAAQLALPLPVDSAPTASICISCADARAKDSDFTWLGPKSSSSTSVAF